MLSLFKRILNRWPFLFLPKRKDHRFARGDTVRVKDRERISGSIQPARKTDGCLFMDQMWDYCGQTFKVSKVVDVFYDERKREHFRPRSSIYILEGLTCEGRMGHFPFQCDRGCFILWHEDWLEKVQESQESPQSVGQQPCTAGEESPPMCQLECISEIEQQNSWLYSKWRSFIMTCSTCKSRVRNTMPRHAGDSGYSKTTSQAPRGNRDQIHPGDMVKVRSQDEIQNTLDTSGRTRGCLFTEGMEAHCGKEYRVFRRVDHFFDEAKQKTCKCNNLFLLEGAYCNRTSCDRNCFYFWHGSWLQKIQRPTSMEGGAGQKS